MGGPKVTPARLLLGVFRAVEPVIADVTSRVTGTPGVMSRLLETERVTRHTMRRVDRLRGDAVHLLLLPTRDDVAAMRRELEKMQNSLNEIEARLDDHDWSERAQSNDPEDERP